MVKHLGGGGGGGGLCRDCHLHHAVPAFQITCIAQRVLLCTRRCRLQLVLRILLGAFKYYCITLSGSMWLFSIISYFCVQVWAHQGRQIKNRKSMTKNLNTIKYYQVCQV